MNEIKIYEARIKSFEGFGEKGDISQKLIIDENSIFSINCVIDFENGKIIDDYDEFVNTLKIPLSKAVDMVMDGEIKDSKTQTVILKAEKYFNK